MELSNDVKDEISQMGTVSSTPYYGLNFTATQQFLYTSGSEALLTPTEIIPSLNLNEYRKSRRS